MAQVNIVNVKFVNNPAKVSDPFVLNVTFQCFQSLGGCLKWRLVYLTPSSDSIIDEFTMESIGAGCMEFRLESNAADLSKLRIDEIVGTHALLLSVEYEGQEFWRVGYFIVNEIVNQPQVQQVGLADICRKVIDESPRIMRMEIEWARHEGSSTFNEKLLRDSLQLFQCDPFKQSNGSLFQQCSTMMDMKMNSKFSS